MFTFSRELCNLSVERTICYGFVDAHITAWIGTESRDGLCIRQWCPTGAWYHCAAHSKQHKRDGDTWTHGCFVIQPLYLHYCADSLVHQILIQCFDEPLQSSASKEQKYVQDDQLWSLVSDEDRLITGQFKHSVNYILFSQTVSNCVILYISSQALTLLLTLFLIIN